MATDRAFAFFGLGSAWDWWRTTDDLWRWGLHTHSIKLYDQADEVLRQTMRRKRIKALLEHARQASPFYQRHYRGVSEGETDLRAYPPVTRQMLMENFDDWVVDRRIRKADLLQFIADPARIAEPYLGEYTIWTSSGTTGVPGVYVQDAHALAVYAALATARFEFGSGLGAGLAGAGLSRFAFLAAIDGHFAGIVSWERQRRLYPAIAMATRAFSILQPMPDLVAQLNAWQPAYISTYPTMMTVLAEESRAGRLQLSLQGLWGGGEGLPAADRANIEDAFGCRIVEDYGASECMNMAFGCSHGRLHTNDDWVVLEPVDENYQPVPPGEPSATVLVSNLANRVQPLLRYDLGDSITVDTEPCACGSIRPAIRVEGRSADVLVLDAVRSGRSRSVAASHAAPPVRILPLAIETVIEEEAGVHRFQLTHTAPAHLQLRLDAASDTERRAAFVRVNAVLTRFLQAQGAAPVHIELDLLPPECNPVSGKLRQVCVLPGARQA